MQPPETLLGRRQPQSADGERTGRVARGLHGALLLHPSPSQSCGPAPTQRIQGSKPASPPLSALVLTPTRLCPNHSRSTPAIQLHHHIPLQHRFISSQLRSLTPAAPSFPLKAVCTQNTAFHSEQPNLVGFLLTQRPAHSVPPPAYWASLCHLLHSYPSWRPTFSQHFGGTITHSQLCREMPRREAAVPK